MNNKYRAFSNNELLALNGALRSRRTDLKPFYNKDNPQSEYSIVWRMYAETNEALTVRGYNFAESRFRDDNEAVQE